MLVVGERIAQNIYVLQFILFVLCLFFSPCLVFQRTCHLFTLCCIEDCLKSFTPVFDILRGKGKSYYYYCNSSHSFHAHIHFASVSFTNGMTRYVH